MFKLQKTKILQELGKSKSGAFLQVVIFLGLFLLVNMPQLFFSEFIAKKFPTIDSVVIYNLTAIIPILLYILIYRVIKKRQFSSFGYKKEGLLKDYGKGLLVGLLFSVIITLICLFSNIITINMKSIGWNNIFYTIIIFVSYIFQALNEETLMRGHLLVQSSRKSQNIWIGVIVNTIIFTALHISNSVIGSLNIALIGLLFSIIFVKRGSLWMCSGAHTAWNFMLHILGVNVSGIEAGSPLFTYKYNKNLLMLNGGSFGFEGSIILTVVLIISIFIFLKQPQLDKAEE